MLEIVGVAVAIVGVYIAYLTLHHQKKSSQTEADGATTVQPASVPPQDIASTENADSAPALVPVPDGIVLGDKVVLVPGLQVRLFTHSGRIEENILRGRAYSWLRRGEVIGRYHMEVPNSDADYFRHIMGTKHLSVDVRSPVDGLILHSGFSHFVHWPTQSDPQLELPTGTSLSILVADDEPAPEKNEYMYGSALRFIHDHKGPLFRHSRYWSMEPMTDEEFSRLVQYQKDAECLVVDALPEFKDYLDEARTKFPNLRPHIKHLK